MYIVYEGKEKERDLFSRTMIILETEEHVLDGFTFLNSQLYFFISSLTETQTVLHIPVEDTLPVLLENNARLSKWTEEQSSVLLKFKMQLTKQD